MTLTVLPDIFAIYHLDHQAEIPAWALMSDFVSITRTGDELSIVCPERDGPEEVEYVGGWRALMQSEGGWRLWISRISHCDNTAMRMLKIRRVGNSNMVALPKDWEADGFAPGTYVLVERDQAGEIRMLRAGDMAARVDALADEMIDKHAEALRILAEHDRGSE